MSTRGSGRRNVSAYKKDDYIEVKSDAVHYLWWNPRIDGVGGMFYLTIISQSRKETKAGSGMHVLRSLVRDVLCPFFCIISAYPGIGDIVWFLPLVLIELLLCVSLRCLFYFSTNIRAALSPANSCGSLTAAPRPNRSGSSAPPTAGANKRTFPKRRLERSSTPKRPWATEGPNSRRQFVQRVVHLRQRPRTAMVTVVWRRHSQKRQQATGTLLLKTIPRPVDLQRENARATTPTATASATATATTIVRGPRPIRPGKLSPSRRRRMPQQLPTRKSLRNPRRRRRRKLRRRVLALVPPEALVRLFYCQSFPRGRRTYSKQRGWRRMRMWKLLRCWREHYICIEVIDAGLNLWGSSSKGNHGTLSRAPV